MPFLFQGNTTTVSCAHPKPACNPERAAETDGGLYARHISNAALYPSCAQAAVLDLLELRGKAATEGTQTRNS